MSASWKNTKRKGVSTCVDNPGPSGLTTRRTRSTIRTNEMNDKQVDLTRFSQSNGSTGDEKCYFVVTGDQTPENCSVNMKKAYKLCEDNGLRIQWMLERDCIAEEPTTGSVFVVDNFNTAAFTHLQTYYKDIMFEIIGPLCIQSVVNGGEPFRRTGEPVLYPIMLQKVICFALMKKHKLPELKTMATRMGAVVTQKYTSATTHLVTDSALNMRCLKAYELETPVMTTEWIEKLWTDAEKVPDQRADDLTEQFTCPIFHNVVACTSQLTTAQKALVKDLMNAHGGMHSGKMDSETCSILVLYAPEGEKYESAKLLNLPCVTVDWVQACVDANHILDTRFYTVPIMASTPKPSNFHVNHASCSAIMGTDAQPNVFFSNIWDMGEIDIAFVKQAAIDTQFLRGCKILVCGDDESLVKEVKSCLNLSGAILFDKLGKTLTHIVVVGSKIPEYIENMYFRLPQKPPIVGIAWVQRSAELGHPADIDNFAISQSGCRQNSEESSSIHSSTTPAEVQDYNNDEISHETTEQPEVQGHQSSELEHQENRNRGSDKCSSTDTDESKLTRTKTTACSQRTGQSCFSHMAFKIVLSDSEEAEISKIITDNGGRVTTLDNYDIVILPPVYDADFVILSEAKCFTKYWVSDKVENMNENELYHRPLRAFRDMKKVMKGVVIALSQYNGYEREYVCIVAQALGAIYQEVFARKASKKDSTLQTTHLISYSTDNKKYTAAVKWNVPVVLLEWVISCYDKRIITDVDSFHPNAFLEKSKNSSGCSALPSTPKSAVPKLPRSLSVLSLAGTKTKQGKISELPLALPVESKNPAVETLDLDQSVDSNLPKRKWPGLDNFANSSMYDPDDSAHRLIVEFAATVPPSPPPIPGISVEASREIRRCFRSTKLMRDESFTSESSGPGPSPQGDYISQVIKRARVRLAKPPEWYEEQKILLRKEFENLNDSQLIVDDIPPQIRTPESPQLEAVPPVIDLEKENEIDNVENINRKRKSVCNENNPVNDPSDKIRSSSHASSCNSTPKETVTEPIAKRKKSSNVRHQEIHPSKANEMPHNEVPVDSAKVESAKHYSPSRLTATFMISGLQTAEKQRVENVIQKFRGFVSKSQNFDPNSIGILTPKLTRSEKILGCIGSGRLVIQHPLYIDSCESAGRLLDPEEFQFTEECISEDGERPLVQAFQRIQRNLKNGLPKPFAAARVYFNVSSKAKLESYIRVLGPSGGLIVSNVNEANLIIEEVGKDNSEIRSHLPKRTGIILRDVIVTNISLDFLNRN